VLLLALPPPAGTSAQPPPPSPVCLPRTQHLLAGQENLEDDNILASSAITAAAQVEEVSMDLDTTHTKD